MSDTTVSLLTAPGTGAIATVEVRGPRAWELAKQLFKPTGKPLPESLKVNRFWFGTLGADEVVLAVTAADTVEVHCHGGRRVVRWVIEQFTANGCVEERTPRPSGEGFELLQRAPTLRTASILLDQINGAFANEVSHILGFLDAANGMCPDFATAFESLSKLTSLAPVGRHLIEPWKVVVAGAPNVGKSSLINALAGYQRSVVSEVAGTTRDTVSVRVAFDGWPVELFDTAGLREAGGLEAAGIAQAREAASEADLVLWVIDGSVHDETSFESEADKSAGLKARLGLFALNKVDRAEKRLANYPHWLIPVSAATGEHVPELAARIIASLVLRVPARGAAVPFTPRLVDLIEAARAALVAGRNEDAARLLREALAASE